MVRAGQNSHRCLWGHTGIPTGESFEISRGRFVTNQDVKAARTVVVIGPDLRNKLFPGKLGNGGTADQ